MRQKKRNYEIAYKIASNAFFRADLFTKYYSESFTMECPTAPPGMPNCYSTWEAERCFCWFNRTVRSWKTEVCEFYQTPGEELFWAIGRWDADVHWGDFDGNFSSKFYMKIILDSEGKVKHLCWRTDPVAMLMAAGRQLPDFDVERSIEAGSVESFEPFKSLIDYGFETISPDISDTEEGISKRIKNALEQHSCGVRRECYRKAVLYTKDHVGYGEFVPKQQLEAEEKYKEEYVNGLNKVMAWVKKSSPWMYRDPRNKVYATDNSNVYFVEMNCHGPGCWEGISGKTGHYKNEYLVYVRFDNNGYISAWIEILNSINIMNSSNVVVENFPYYY